MDLFKDGRYDVRTFFARGNMVVSGGKIVEADQVWKKHIGMPMDIFYGKKLHQSIKPKYLGR